MKAILFFALVSLLTTPALAKRASCSLAAAQVVNAMHAGTAFGNSALRSSVRYGFDDNSDLVYIVNVLGDDGPADREPAKYKVVAKGSKDNCQILSAHRLAN